MRYQNSYKNNLRLNVDQVYEEFRGTLTGNDITKAYLSKEDYLSLGVKQSLFDLSVREQIYDLFLKYLDYLKKNQNYDPNIVAYNTLPSVVAKYDYLIIDEVQDLTNIQIKLLLSALKTPFNFILCGDSNQIIHPNFFSWAKIKTLFYQAQESNQNHANMLNIQPSNIVTILANNYRNSRTIVDIANKVLKIKQKQFGSIDKESNYLVESVVESQGTIFLLNKKSTGNTKSKSKLSSLN
jgi:superfamily I DNA/RNA helicase